MGGREAIKGEHTIIEERDKRGKDGIGKTCVWINIVIDRQHERSRGDCEGIRRVYRKKRGLEREKRA